MPKLPEVVTKKVGPLPLWGWVVAGAGAVFIFSRFKGGRSSAGAGSSAGIGIPVLTPSGSSSPSGAADGSIGQGGNAVGSPSQNVMGGADTQPGGAPPWWSKPPPWWTVAPAGVPTTPVANSPGGNPGGATVGPHLWPTAAELAAEPPGGWTKPPLFQQVSPDRVLDTTGGGRGVVNPANRLVGYSDPKTGAFSKTPVAGWAAIWK